MAHFLPHASWIDIHFSPKAQRTIPNANDLPHTLTPTIQAKTEAGFVVPTIF
jgi:hypothetical protein